MKQTPEERIYRVQMMESAKRAYERYNVTDRLKGVYRCREIVPTKGFNIVYYPDGSLGLLNAYRCRNNASCPLCSYGQSMSKRNEIAYGIWSARQKKHDVKIVTYTFSHHAGDDLTDIRQMFSASMQRLYRDGTIRRWMKDIGCLGRITDDEIRMAGMNGYHLHSHQLWFFNEDVSNIELENNLCDKYMYCLSKSGLYARKDLAVKVSGYQGVGDYITKMSSELTISNYKNDRGNGSMSPFQYLAYCMEDGDDLDWLLWLDYVIKIRYKRQVGWSRGLKDYLGVKDREIEKDENQAKCLIGIFGNINNVGVQSFMEDCLNDIDSAISWVKNHNYKYVVDSYNLAEYREISTNSIKDIVWDL